MQNLEYIITIAEEQSLIKASEKLFVSPSALSQHVSRLEATLGSPLFTRSRVGWSPTAAGLLYIDMAKKIVSLERQTYAHINSISSDYSHTVSLGVSPGRMVDIMAHCFPIISAHFPALKLFLCEDSVSNNVRQLLRQKIDIGFVTSSSEYSELAEIETHLLRSEGFVLALPASHPLAHEFPAQIPFPTLPLRFFQNCEFMLLHPDTTLREAQNILFERAGFTPKIVFESSNSQTIRTLMQAGYAAALIPASYAIPSSGNAYFNIDDPLRWNLFAAHHAAHKLSAPETQIISLAAAYCNRA